MTRSTAAHIGIAIVFVSMVFVTAATLGPRSRTFAPGPRVLASPSIDAIASQWEALGIRGRKGVLFTRRLNAVEPGADGQTSTHTETAMHRGVLREVWHVVPDGAWGEVAATLDRREMARRHGPGFLLLFEDVRVNVVPLSQFTPPAEKALVVIDAGSWSPEALETIGNLFRGGRLTADLVSLLRGEPSTLRLFTSALSTETAAP